MPEAEQDLHALFQTLQEAKATATETIRPSYLQPQSPQEVPKTLPDLEPLGLLGEGGMGQVQLVRQRSLDRQVALKRLKPSQRLTANVVGLLQEARRTGMLEHPNIIPVHAVNIDEDGSPAILMKRVEGISWRKLIKDPTHPLWANTTDHLGRNLEILMQVCNAVHFAHSRGIIHRDIKPENIMLGGYGEVYLLDWGISFRLNEDAPSQEVVGTLAYLAPEMLQGSAKVGPQTDVYLLGASLHEALTGRPRHQGASLRAVMLSAFQSEPYSYPEEIPAELASVCNKAMHRRPEERFQTALEVREALASFLKHRSSIDLSEAAQKRLQDALSPADHERHRQNKLFTESRFGFEQALRIWPENKGAQQGLLRCLQAMFDHELSLRNLSAATELLADMPLRDELRQAQLQAEAQKLEGEQREQRRLAELSHQLDLSVSRRQRIYFGLGIASFMTLLSIIFISLRYWQNAGTSYPTHILAASVTVGFLALLVWRGKDSLLKTDINRRTIYSFLVGASAVPVMRTIGMILWLPINAIATCELLMMGMASMILGVNLQKGFFISSGVLLLGALCSLLLPQLWLEVWMSSYFLFALSVSYVWKRA